ncbi:hypothetical protein J7E93_21885 [Streptomyces sp. ISL-36]|uniref:hypothetical protein n=1 Tax=Streptomyces sp. ISL-36 TaxID=2819182 RepID=UPI001BEB0386|nr:hypothetical protein [Streptomyces sp. ISL-36]MBT2442710.1 hypothetical protein [Streptomyces sp. ISL-36]
MPTVTARIADPALTQPDPQPGPPAPTVTVVVGRIEVRAAHRPSAPPPAPPRDARPKQVAPDLESYLSGLGGSA